MKQGWYSAGQRYVCKTWSEIFASSEVYGGNFKRQPLFVKCHERRHRVWACELGIYEEAKGLVIQDGLQWGVILYLTYTPSAIWDSDKKLSQGQGQRIVLLLVHTSWCRRFSVTSSFGSSKTISSSNPGTICSFSSLWLGGVNHKAATSRRASSRSKELIGRQDPNVRFQVRDLDTEGASSSFVG